MSSSVEPDSRIYESDDHINDEVGQNHGDDRQERHTLNDRVITEAYCVDQHAAESGPVEYCFCNDRSPEENTHVEPDDRGDGDECVAQGMLPGDEHLLQA